MDGKVVKESADVVLLDFLESADESAGNRLLERLVCEYAQPLIKEIVDYKLRVHTAPSGGGERQDVEDVSGEVVVKLVKRLRDLKTSPLDGRITNLRSYVAVMAYHACDAYLRHKYPQRHRLKNQMRYLLTHQPGFALWEGQDDQWLCGFAEWRDAGRATAASARIYELRARMHDFKRQKLANSSAQAMNPADLLAAIFDWVGNPFELDQLVSVVADLWGVSDRVIQADGDDRHQAGSLEHSYDPRGQMETARDHRHNLERLWVEICQLPLKQRIALLLSLRDEQGRAVIRLLPLIRLASLRQIAAVLGMAAEQLAEIWEDLPFDDLRIASRLDVTRQQVINLRKSARERLARRTKAFDPIK